MNFQVGSDLGHLKLVVGSERDFRTQQAVLHVASFEMSLRQQRKGDLWGKIRFLVAVTVQFCIAFS